MPISYPNIRPPKAAIMLQTRTCVVSLAENSGAPLAMAKAAGMIALLGGSRQ